MRFPRLRLWRYPAALAVLLITIAFPVFSDSDLDCLQKMVKEACRRLQTRGPSAFIEENRGQAPGPYAFYSRRQDGITALFAAEGLTVSSPGAVLRAVWGGNARKVRPHGMDRLPTVVNYLIGRDSSRWITNVPTFGAVRYEDLYDGISAIYYPKDAFFEQDFEVRPGANPAAIRLRIEGADSVHLRDGGLEITIGGVTMNWKAPIAYQEDRRGTRKTAVAAKFRLDASTREVSFDIGAYDRGRTLVIDPVITFATYFGRSGSDLPGRTAVDAQGNIYLAGGTNDPTFPVIPSGQATPTNPGSTGNAVLVKMNATGTAALLVTHFGGSTTDNASGITLDAAGNIYLVGLTDSQDYPTTANALRANAHPSDPGSCFITKFNPSANRILYSTYLGGQQHDACSSIALDSTGAMYVAGVTASRDFPATPDTFQPTFRVPGAEPGYDGFVTKINAAGNAIAYSTFYGGSGNDVVMAMALDGQRNVYIAGFTNSTNLPVTPNAWQSRYGGGSLASETMFFSIGDGFAAKINTDGSQLVYSTYVGGREDDLVLGLAVDAQGFAYLAGGTRSNDFPVTPNALQTINRGSGGENRYPSGDGFVVKLNGNGSGAEYSTYLGGVSDDRAVGIAVDSEGNAWVTGHSLSTDFPVTSDAQQRAFGGMVTSESITFGDAFVTKLNATGGRILYSTYFGGSGNEVAHDAAVTSEGSVIVTGMTSSRNLATTPGVLQPRGGVGDPQVAPFNDMFVLKVGEPPASPPVSISSVRNEASRLGDAVAPGMVVTITGANLSNRNAIADSAGGHYPIEVGGTVSWPETWRRPCCR